MFFLTIQILVQQYHCTYNIRLFFFFFTLWNKNNVAAFWLEKLNRIRIRIFWQQVLKIAFPICFSHTKIILVTRKYKRILVIFERVLSIIIVPIDFYSHLGLEKRQKQLIFLKLKYHGFQLLLAWNQESAVQKKALKIEIFLIIFFFCKSLFSVSNVLL